jgi:hypothetical protein
MQSAFNVAALYTSLADITAAEPVTGIVLGIVVFGTASPYRRVILVARSPALSRRHRSRPPRFELHPAR